MRCRRVPRILEFVAVEVGECRDGVGPCLVADVTERGLAARIRRADPLRAFVPDTENRTVTAGAGAPEPPVTVAVTHSCVPTTSVATSARA